ncbi:hypothetical protein AMATHDRAFT_11121 [Amanita thiersii Skay4041]|uniref:Uncharacterized protein n=1 Tax=Amanita thiersii Skay4041 TaxID=703135 RepID=A0A2A9NAQ2_9AGAR|nr:hypothetical protein AMATHDRAFT_11121 [Amanita thiersii Skay4041]
MQLKIMAVVLALTATSIFSYPVTQRQRRDLQPGAQGLRDDASSSYSLHSLPSQDDLSDAASSCYSMHSLPSQDDLSDTASSSYSMHSPPSQDDLSDAASSDYSMRSLRSQDDPSDAASSNYLIHILPSLHSTGHPDAGQPLPEAQAKGPGFFAKAGSRGKEVVNGAVEHFEKNQQKWAAKGKDIVWGSKKKDGGGESGTSPSSNGGWFGKGKTWLRGGGENHSQGTPKNHWLAKGTAKLKSTIGGKSVKSSRVGRRSAR